MGRLEQMLSLRHWTAADLADLPEDGLRYEALDGQLVVTPPPVARHQAVAFALARQLHAEAPPDWLVLPGQAVRMGTDWRIPDLIVVPSGVPLDGLFYEPADVGLAIEVVSASSRRLDRVVKPAEYAEAGIARYWRVETDPRVVVVAYELRAGAYVEVPPSAPFPVHLDVAGLEPPRPGQTFLS